MLDYNKRMESSKMRYRITFLNSYCTVDTMIDLKEKWDHIVEPFMKIEIDEFSTVGQIHFCFERNKQPIVRKDIGIFLDLHCNLVGRMFSENNVTTIWVDELGVFYVLEQNEDVLFFNYYFTEYSEEINMDFMRIVRGALISIAEAMGLMKAHMSIVATGDSASAFIGDEGAGKTSFMLSYLTQFKRAALITNDKTLLVISKDQQLDAYGLPYAVSIGAGALIRLPEIRIQDKTRIINKEAYFWPVEVTLSLKRKISKSAKISRIFYVRIAPERDGIDCVPIYDPEEKKTHIQKHVINFSDRISPKWLDKWIGVSNAPVDIIVDNLLRIPMYRLEGNPWQVNLNEVLNSQK